MPSFTVLSIPTYQPIIGHLIKPDVGNRKHACGAQMPYYVPLLFRVLYFLGVFEKYTEI